MTYVHRFKSKCLHFAIIHFNKFIIQNALFVRLVDIFHSSSSICLTNARDILRLPLAPNPYISCHSGLILRISHTMFCSENGNSYPLLTSKKCQKNTKNKIKMIISRMVLDIRCLIGMNKIN